ncbi:MAG: hypothetical protein GTO02_04525, partial [Candidatus Dadabacteria bacterium]|nr:hypothetical protein [Candidatus Dadabacteria bacterium]NIQ13684.1 hypothetical protein [Candidatus Dadabacteria bacterium]
MKTKTFITSIIILITLLINISCENNQKDYQSDSVNVENIETDFEGMQSKYPSDNSAWDILDENIKSKIQLDYKNTKDKREFFENYY